MSRTVTLPYNVAGDAPFIAKALGDIARAKGMAQVACDAGLSRESLYKALSGDRNPTLGTVLRVIAALGLKLRAEAVPDSAAAGEGAQGNVLRLAGPRSRRVTGGAEVLELPE